MKFDNKYFIHFPFDEAQIEKNLQNALKDLAIAEKDEILEVKFNYAYTALIKAGITLLSFYKVRTKAIPGHHIKIIDKVSEILKDASIADTGNIMRSKRNLDLYSGGIEITEKECREYLKFIEKVITKIKDIITS